MTEKLILNAPNLDVYIIPDAVSGKSRYREGKDGAGMLVFSVRDILKSAGLLIAASLIGFFFYNLGIDEANIITIYVLSVLLTALVTENQIYSLISAAVSVLVFNFLFTEPRFSLQAYDAGYPLTFGVMFLAAFITGSLVMRLKSHARQSAGVAFRTRILFDTNRLLQQAREKDDIIQVTASQLMKLLNRNIVIYPEENGSLGEPRLFLFQAEMTEKLETVFLRRSRKRLYGPLKIINIQGLRRIPFQMPSACIWPSVSMKMSMECWESCWGNLHWRLLRAVFCCLCWESAL